MRLTDISDFFAIRRLAANASEVVRFRHNRDAGAELSVEMRGLPPLHLRGGRSDYHMFHRIFLKDEYRLSSLDLGSMCVVDLGGNIGVFSARVAPHAERVIVCEPMPVNFSRLEKNTGAFGNVVARRVAISDRKGALEMFAPREGKRSGSYSVHLDQGSHDPGESCEVATMTLDDLFREQAVERCDLLKLDIEGSEYDVLHSLGESVWASVQRIHGEYHDVRPEDPRTRWESLLGLLQGKGFAVESVPHRRKPNHGMFFAWRAT